MLYSLIAARIILITNNYYLTVHVTVLHNNALNRGHCHRCGARNPICGAAGGVYKPHARKDCVLKELLCHVVV